MYYGNKNDIKIICNEYGVQFPKAEIEIYKIDDNIFEFYYGFKGKNGGPYVTICKQLNGKWHYVRLNNVSVSEEYDDLQSCINSAYNDMIRSKY